MESWRRGGFCTLGNPSHVGSGGALEPQKGVQCSKTGAPKAKWENSPQRFSQRALPSWAVAQVLSSALSEWRLAAKGQASGVRPQRGGQCWLPQRYSEANQENSQSARETKDHSCKKALVLHFGSAHSQNKGPLPSRCWKGVSCFWSAAPETKR